MHLGSHHLLRLATKFIAYSFHSNWILCNSSSSCCYDFIVTFCSGVLVIGVGICVGFEVDAWCREGLMGVMLDGEMCKPMETSGSIGIEFSVGI